MPSSVLYRLLSGCCLLLLRQGAKAQPATVSADSAAQYYSTAGGYNARLYNGAEYIRTYPNIVGHPFIASDSMQPGWIAYDGVLYRGVLLNFDIVRDEVIVRGAQSFSISLVPQKVDSFSIAGRLFMRMPLSPNSMAAIYEVLYKGGVWVLVKHTKQSSPAARPEDPLQFVAAAAYYIKQGAEWHHITHKNDLLHAFKDHKEAIKKYLQQSDLNVRQNPAATLAAAAAYYDKIAQ